MLWWWGDPWGAGHWVGIGFMTVFWIAVIVGLALLIRHAASRSAASSRPSADSGQGPPVGADTPETGGSGQVNNEALRILEERYARGDIGRDEFLRVKEDLGG